MIAEQKPKPSVAQVGAWLAEQYDDDVVDLTPLRGGFWSSAFSYRAGTNDYVLRLSDMAEGFVIDQAAMQFASSELPVPDVVAVGEALGHHFAISRRHYGRFLETIALDEAAAAGTALAKLLQAMRQAPLPPTRQVVWYAPPDSDSLTWHQWLKGGLVDNADRPADGWRAKLAADSRLDALFQTAEARILALLSACPERRDLIHGDLLHQNVLVNQEATEVTAVFSWKCSALGDFLYDVAWCTLWGNWFPAIAATDMWQRTLAAPDLTEDDLHNAPLRHHCYELQIAASHLGWFTWTGETEHRNKLAGLIEGLLERGPLT